MGSHPILWHPPLASALHVTPSTSKGRMIPTWQRSSQTRSHGWRDGQTPPGPVTHPHSLHLPLATPPPLGTVFPGPITPPSQCCRCGRGRSPSCETPHKLCQVIKEGCPQSQGMGVGSQEREQVAVPWGDRFWAVRWPFYACCAMSTQPGHSRPSWSPGMKAPHFPFVTSVDIGFQGTPQGILSLGSL